MRRTTAALAAVAVLAGGCSSGPGPRFSATVRLPAGAAPGSPGADDSASCPASYAPPDPNRPQIRLSFDLGADRHTVTGTEHVVFTPDLPVRELVFRLTANTAPSAAAGNSITVSSATAGAGGAAFRVDRAGADEHTQGGLLVLPLAAEVPAGQQVTADVAFTLRLGGRTFDRFGTAPGTAWWGSGQPLLAWERGVGWHTEPMLRFLGESATSEAARIDLTVTAPARLTVLATGTPDPAVDAGSGRRRWHSVADRARDVSVAAGGFTVKQQTVDGTRVIVGTPAGEGRPDELLAAHVKAVRELSSRFGPFPFPVLTVTRLPVVGGGIEYPGSILMLDDGLPVAVHETAHQWFYAMVGDSQARDPWLDEAFATYAEELVDNDADDTPLKLPGRVGQSMQDFGDRENEYFTLVYGKGSAALAVARAAAGPAKFDAALRCYVNANAWRIARPADLAAALAGLPAAVAVLRRAGALP